MKYPFSIVFARNWLARVLVVAGLYAGFALLWGSVAVTEGKVPASWPATGLAIAAVWWGGYRLAPAVGLGTFLLLLLTGVPVFVSGGIAIGNMIESLLAVYLIRRWGVEPRLFDRVHPVFRYILQVGVAATFPGAVLGVASLCQGAVADWEAFPSLVPLWWATDLMGALVATPFLLVWAWPGKLAWTAREAVEASAAFVALTVVCMLIFGAEGAPFQVGFPAAFPIMPIIVWIAVRLGQRAAVSATLVACVFAICGTLRGRGPFAETTMPLLLLHIYVAVVASTALVLGASVAERNEAERLVRENEARKTAMLETAFDAIISMNHTGVVHEWNLAAERIFGYRRAQAINCSLDELIVPAEAGGEYPKGLADRLITEERRLVGQAFELVALGAEGKKVCVEIAVTRVPASEPPAYTVIIHDLTRRRQVESALRLSEERLRLLVECVKDYAIYMIDPEGRVATWNEGAERIKGYRDEEIIGRPFATFFTPEDIRRGVPDQVLKQAEKEGRALYEGLRMRKDGACIWVQGTITAMRDETGRLVGYSKVAQDITGLRRAEEALRLSETHFRTLAEELPELVSISGPDGACEYVTPQWSRYSGVPGSKLLGFGGTLELVHPEDRLLAADAWRLALGTTTPFDIEFRLRRADGEHRWFRAQAVPVRNVEGRVVKWIGTNTDVDDQKRASEVLEIKVKERTAQLQAALASVEELLYTIAHDLRAPNRSMQGFAELIQAECGNQLDTRARDYLNRISAAAVRNDELIRDLLNYGRLSHETAPLGPVDTRRAVDTVLHAVENEARIRDAKIQVGREWPRVVANEPLLEQILTHLVINALQYVPLGRKPEISIASESGNGKAILRVTDNGIGIPPGQIERVFKPFTRFPQPVLVPGTGMGLAFVKRAAERMNGSVGVASTPDKGSCFWVRLRTA